MLVKTLPYNFVEIQHYNKLARNMEATITCFNEGIANLDRDNGKEIKKYLFGDEENDIVASVNKEYSGGEIWQQGIDCGVTALIKIDLRLNGKLISKEEILELIIMNGRSKYLGLITFV